MIRLEMKDYSMILIEKLQKYQPYYQANLISVSILLVKKYYHLIKKKKRKKEQAKFAYSPLGKTFETQIKTIEDQEGRQIKAIQNQGQIKPI